ncbi:hypothetical protein VRN60_001940, partial [Campylobacter coli]|nr:hypothetical protein [Campylobacter coli]
ISKQEFEELSKEENTHKTHKLIERLMMQDVGGKIKFPFGKIKLP